MRRKLSVLRACRRVLRPGGRLAFTTILPTPGLPPAARRRANGAGTAFAVRTSYPSLLGSAGFTDVVDVDVTDDYRATLLRWMDATARREPAVRAITGDEFYDERLANRRRTLGGIDDGILQRRLYTAVIR